MASANVSHVATIVRGLPTLLIALVVGCSADAPPAPASSDTASSVAQESRFGHRLCGGASNRQCADDEFCLPFFSKSCPGPHAVGLCVSRPNHCTPKTDPVCGCDGTTYDNFCDAAQAGASIEHRGACAAAPSCGGRGQTCPGAGTCVSAAADDDGRDCDRDHDALHGFFGDRDDHHASQKVCQCTAAGHCAAGERWNDDPTVCACEKNPDPCSTLACKAAEVCIPSMDGTAACVADACASVACRTGDVCVTQADGTSACITDACAGVTCRTGEVCTVQTNGTSACVADACAGFVCKTGGVCVVRSDGTPACH